MARKGSGPATYDAFLSYAHEDQETVAWLHRILSRYWVVGRRRRNVFFDRESLRAGALSEEIDQALANSRHLVVCASKDAAGSDWVEHEARTYLRGRERKRVLVCSVGEAEIGPAGLPPTLRGVEKETGEPWFRPDLTGQPQAGWGRKRLRARNRSLALLAAILDMPDKHAILDRRKKAWILLSAALLLVVLALAGRSIYLGTETGRFGTMVETVLADAERELFDSPDDLEAAAAGLGRMERLDELEGLCNYLSDADFLARVRLTGQLARRRVDEDAVLAAIASARGPSLPKDLRLRAHRRCAPRVPRPALPEPEDPDQVESRIRALAGAGLADEAGAMLRAHAVELGPRCLPLQVAVALDDDTRPDPFPRFEGLDPTYQTAWIESIDPRDVIGETTGWILEFDVQGRLDEGGVDDLIRLAKAHALVPGPDSETPGPMPSAYWTPHMALAAFAAGAGQVDDARALLRIPVAPERSLPKAPSHARGHAWRGLAFHRLGEPEAAGAAFTEAVTCVTADIPATRSFREWHDIVKAMALADEWHRAFDALDLIESDSRRRVVRLDLIGLFSRRRGE